MKVYVTTDGIYSDYGITGIWSTKELAQAYLDYAYPDNKETNDIEEYDLDALRGASESGKHEFTVAMDREGNTKYISTAPLDEDKVIPTIAALTNNYEREGELWLRVITVTDTDVHAVKIANEIRTRIVANNDWTLGEERWSRQLVNP